MTYQRVAWIHLVPAAVLYGLTLLTVDLGQLLREPAKEAIVGYSLMALLGCGLYLGGWLLQFLVPEEFWREGRSAVRMLVAAVIFFARIWFLAAFEMFSLLLLLMTLIGRADDPPVWVVLLTFALTLASHFAYERGGVLNRVVKLL